MQQTVQIHGSVSDWTQRKKNYLRKIWFTINVISRKQRKNIKNTQIEAKKSLNVNPCIRSQSNNSEKKKIFRRKIQFLESMLFSSYINYIYFYSFIRKSTRFAAKITLYSQFRYNIFYKFTNVDVTAGTRTNKIWIFRVFYIMTPDKQV